MRVLPLVVLTAAIAGASQPAFSIRVQAVDSPAAANSAEPQLSVSARGVLLSWIEREGARASLRFAERTETRWTTPRTVASGDNWFVNWADVPSVVRLADGTLAAHWLQKSGTGTYTYDVRLSYSKDDGRTWSESFLPHHDDSKSEHGFASLFQMPGSGLGLVWLDGRAMQMDHQTSGQDHAGAMTLRFAAFDKQWKQVADLPVDLRVCDCCPTTTAVTAEGPIVAFRDRSETEVRDIFVSRLERGRWTEPVAVFKDDWQINACPVNGPILAARGRAVAIAWFNGKESGGRAFVAFSSDSGRTFGAPVRVDDNGTLGRVGVDLLEDGSAVVSWIEYSARTAEFRLRRVEASGAKSPAVTVTGLTSDRSSGYPRLARSREELVMAWTESTRSETAGGSPRLQVRTAIARLVSNDR